MATSRAAQGGAVMGATRITSKEIGKRLIERLEQLGWSRLRLAMEVTRYAGVEVVGESQVARIIAGERFNPLTVKMLAETMGLSYLWLVDGIGPRLIQRSEDEQLRIAEEQDPRLTQLRRVMVSLDDEQRATVLGLAQMLAGGGATQKRRGDKSER